MGCSHSQFTEDGQKLRQKWSKCRVLGLVFLIVIIIVLSYLIYCKMSKPKTIVGIDLNSLGLAPNMYDITLFPTFPVRV